MRRELRAADDQEREPGADRLAPLPDVLDGPTALYVLTGIKASQDDLEILRFIQQMPPPVKGQTRALLAALQARDEC